MFGVEAYKCQLNGAAETGGRGFVFSGIAVVGGAGEREVGFGFIAGVGHGSTILGLSSGVLGVWECAGDGDLNKYTGLEGSVYSS